MRLEIEEEKDRRKVANILIRNGYKVWVVKKCTLDMGGMAGSTYKHYLFAEKTKS